MSGPFDPNNILQNAEQQAKDRADSAIDDVASKVPGGDQMAQQAKDAANQGIDQAGQAGMQQAGEKLGGMGGVGQQVEGMLGSSGQAADPSAGNDPNAGEQGSNS
jgi:hypothetical protein